VSTGLKLGLGSTPDPTQSRWVAIKEKLLSIGEQQASNISNGSSWAGLWTALLTKVYLKKKKKPINLRY